MINTTQPTLIETLKKIKVKKISAGSYFSLVLDSDGEVYGFGNNLRCELGIGDTMNRYTPIKINLPEKIEQIATGFEHCIVYSNNNSLYAWGQNM
jgi:alpha-tubulin suppressor-like RCC1 family protein